MLKLERNNMCMRTEWCLTLAFALALFLAGLPHGLPLTVASAMPARPQASATATIKGIVRAVDGTALGRVTVTATRVGPLLTGAASESALDSGRSLTGAQGDYELASLMPGRYAISAGVGIPSGATRAGFLDVRAGTALTVDFTMPPVAARSRVLNGRMTLNAESAGKPLPKRMSFGNATVAPHVDGTVTALMPPGMRRITVHTPEGYFVVTVTVDSEVVYSVRELQRTPNPMAFAFAVPLEPNPSPEFVITLGTRTVPVPQGQ